MSNEMESLFSQLIAAVDPEPARDGLRDTPKRAAAALSCLTKGYRQNLDQILNNALFESDNRDMVIVRDIEFYSLCEHHMVPFYGQCHVGYIPDGKVLGLSKVARICDMYSRRLQIQERLTQQIARAIEIAVNPSGVAVILESRHLCMMMRGVEKQHSAMITSCMLGLFEKVSTRMEFLNLIKT